MASSSSLISKAVIYERKFYHAELIATHYIWKLNKRVKNNYSKYAIDEAYQICYNVIDLLCEKGTQIGEPVVKHIEDDICELRPLDNRILFAYYKDNAFILLHHFVKKTRKTPPRETKQAKRNLADYIERNSK